MNLFKANQERLAGERLARLLMGVPIAYDNFVIELHKIANTIPENRREFCIKFGMEKFREQRMMWARARAKRPMYKRRRWA